MRIPRHPSTTLTQVVGQLEAMGDGLGGDHVIQLLEQVDWSVPPALDDIAGLRGALLRLEVRRGTRRAHRVASERVLAGWPDRELVHDRGHEAGLLAFDVSAEGRFLAVGSGGASDVDGTIQVWEIGSGRCVHTLTGIHEGIGFSGDEPRRLRWHPSGERVGATFATNQVGVFDPFGDDPEPTAWPDAGTETDDTSPAWCWRSDGRQLAVISSALPCSAHDSDHGLPLVLFDYRTSEDRRDQLGDPVVLCDVDGEGADVTMRSPSWSLDGASVVDVGAVLRLDGAGSVDETGPSARLVENGDGTFRLSDPETDGGGDLRSFVPDPTGRRFAAVDGDSVVLGELTAAGPVVLSRVFRPAGDAPAGEYGPGVLQWSPDGHRLVVALDSGLAVLGRTGAVEGRTAAPAPVRWVNRYAGDARSLAVDGGGSRVVGLDESRRAWVYRLSDPDATGALEQVAVVHMHHDVRGVALSGDGAVLAGWGPTVLEFVHLGDGWRTRFALHPENGPLAHHDAGHPLSYPGGSAVGLFDEDPAFAVPTTEGWEWMGVLPGGVVICPPAARDALRTSLSFVLDRRCAWPAHWADGTRFLSVHRTWAEAERAAHLPEPFPTALHDWWDAVERGVATVDQDRGFRSVPFDQLVGGATGTARVPRRATAHYRPGHTWRRDEITPQLLEQLAGQCLFAEIDDMDGLHLHGPRPLIVLHEPEQSSDAHVFMAFLDTAGDCCRATYVAREEIVSLAVPEYLGHPDDQLEA